MPSRGRPPGRGDVGARPPRRQPARSRSWQAGLGGDSCRETGASAALLPPGGLRSSALTPLPRPGGRGCRKDPQVLVTRSSWSGTRPPTPALPFPSLPTRRRALDRGVGSNRAPLPSTGADALCSRSPRESAELCARASSAYARASRTGCRFLPAWSFRKSLGTNSPAGEIWTGPEIEPFRLCFATFWPFKSSIKYHCSVATVRNPHV